jgi:hypothetical protein
MNIKDIKWESAHSVYLAVNKDKILALVTMDIKFLVP